MQLDPRKLRTMRQSKALSQTDLAEAADVRQATISDLENGKPARPSTVRSIARALGVEPVELMSPVNEDGDQSED